VVRRNGGKTKNPISPEVKKGAERQTELTKGWDGSLTPTLGGGKNPVQIRSLKLGEGVVGGGRPGGQKKQVGNVFASGGGRKCIWGDAKKKESSKGKRDATTVARLAGTTRGDQNKEQKAAALVQERLRPGGRGEGGRGSEIQNCGQMAGQRNLIVVETHRGKEFVCQSHSTRQEGVRSRSWDGGKWT